MSYGFLYDSEKTEERETGTQFGRKADPVICAAVFLLLTVIIAARIFIFGNIKLNDLLHRTADGKSLTEENIENKIGFDSAADNIETGVWQVVEIEGLSGENITDLLVITLPEGTENSDVTLVNYYRDRAFTVSVAGTSKSDVLSTEVYADITPSSQDTVSETDSTVDSDMDSAVGSAAVRYSGDALQISVTMNGIFEYETEIKDGRLYVHYFSPRDLYKSVVVVDPIKNYNSDVTALVAEEIEKQAAEAGIKVYVTRETDGNRSEAERIALMVDACPDIILQIDISSSTDTGEYGLSAYYNGKFFMPEMSNAELANLFLRDTAVAVSDRAISVGEADGDNILMLVDTPSAGINIGYMSNESERNLLENSEYREKMAGGIVTALQEILE